MLLCRVSCCAQLLDSSMVFRMLYSVLPKDCGIWGRVIPLTHVPAHAELMNGDAPSARERFHAKEPVVDGPDDASRLRCAFTLLDT